MAKRRRSLIYESVILNIKEQLFSGELRPGDRLPSVAALSEQLEISQASVREAYRVLESLGVVEVVQGRGTTVAATFEGSSSDEGAFGFFQMAERQSQSYLFEVRKLLEPELAGLAAARATATEVEAIYSAAVEMENLFRQVQDFIEPDIRFHELLAIAAHNPLMLRMLTELSNLLLDSRRHTSRIPGASEKAIHYYKLIAAAIRDQNPESARTLMYQHIADVERDNLNFGREGTGDRRPAAQATEASEPEAAATERDR